MSIEVKKQHYVWEFYLKGWAKEKKIWCLRNGRIFNTSTENIAQERYFYELKKFTDAEISLAESLLKHKDELTNRVRLNTFHTYLFVSEGGKKSRRFGVEWHHGMIESKSIEYIEKLRNGDSDFLNNKASRIGFCVFLGQQYMRTKKIRNSFSFQPGDAKIPNEYKECDFQKIFEAMSFVYADAVGNSIYGSMDIKLVKNTSNTRLITSDQPIYNLAAVVGDVAPEMSIYYPISPLYAIFASKSPCDKKIDSDIEAAGFNKFMADNSHEMLFAEQYEDLTIYRQA